MDDSLTERSEVSIIRLTKIWGVCLPFCLRTRRMNGWISTKFGTKFHLHILFPEFDNRLHLSTGAGTESEKPGNFRYMPTVSQLREAYARLIGAWSFLNIIHCTILPKQERSHLHYSSEINGKSKLGAMPKTLLLSSKFTGSVVYGWLGVHTEDELWA